MTGFIFPKKVWSKKSKKYGELCYFLNLLLLECSVVEIKTVTSQPYCARTQRIGGEEPISVVHADD